MARAPCALGGWHRIHRVRLVLASAGPAQPMSVVWEFVASVIDSIGAVIARLIDRRKGDSPEDPH
ncbi:hypothetical protein CHE218_04810 [Microbacterium sp. che218]